MKIVLAAIAAFLLTASMGYGAWVVVNLNEANFGAITLFNGNPGDGSLVVTGKVARQRTALDFWPHDGPLPSEHALTETVWYRTRFKDWPNFERMNFTAMADNAPMYRFGVERGGSGQHRPIYFCFEDVSPGVADCKFYIGRDGVWIRQGSKWAKIGD